MAKGTPWGEVSGTTKVRFRRKSYKFLLRGFMRLFGLGYILLELLLIGLLGLARNGLRLGCFGVGHDRGFLPTQRSRTRSERGEREEAEGVGGEMEDADRQLRRPDSSRTGDTGAGRW